MKIKQSEIKRILFITLSNIGDIVLTTPVLRALSENFPASAIDVMVSPAGIGLFEKHPAVSDVISYDKRSGLRDKLRLIARLRRADYDFVADMRNSLFRFLIGSRYGTDPFRAAPKGIRHKKLRHLWKLSSMGIGVGQEDFRFYLHIPPGDGEYVKKIMAGPGRGRPLVAISPGAKSSVKRWPEEKYAELAGRLVRDLGCGVIMVGDGEDAPLVKKIISSSGAGIADFSGRTTLCQLASVLSECDMLITNDSAPLHIAGAVGTRTLAIFGPTDPAAYGPTGADDRVVRKKIKCVPCGKAQCRFNHECMRLIETEEVFEAAKDMLKDRR